MTTVLQRAPGDGSPRHRLPLDKRITPTAESLLLLLSKQIRKENDLLHHSVEMSSDVMKGRLEMLYVEHETLLREIQASCRKPRRRVTRAAPNQKYQAITSKGQLRFDVIKIGTFRQTSRQLVIRQESKSLEIWKGSVCAHSIPSHGLKSCRIVPSKPLCLQFELNLLTNSGNVRVMPYTVRFSTKYDLFQFQSFAEQHLVSNRQGYQ